MNSIYSKLCANGTGTWTIGKAIGIVKLRRKEQKNNETFGKFGLGGYNRNKKKTEKNWIDISIGPQFPTQRNGIVAIFMPFNSLPVFLNVYICTHSI